MGGTAKPPAEILHSSGSFHPGGSRMLFSDRMEASSMVKHRGWFVGARIAGFVVGGHFLGLVGARH
jgi:hypothetical protein